MAKKAVERPSGLVSCNHELNCSINIRSQDDQAGTRTTNRKDEIVVILNERTNIAIVTFFDTVTWASGLSGASPPGLRSVSLWSSPAVRRIGCFL